MQRSPVMTSAWRRFDHDVAVPDHLFVIPDVHGHAEMLEVLLHQVGCTCANPGLRKHLVFTGDLIDRGPENVRSIELAFSADQLVDALTILPGNHELMLMDVMDAGNKHSRENQDIWIRNGGAMLLVESEKCNYGDLLPGPKEIACILKELLPDGYVERYRAAPSHIWCGDLLLVHAGIPSPAIQQSVIDLETFLALPQSHHNGIHWAWIREGFLESRGAWGPKGPSVVIHGHTIECGTTFQSVSDAAQYADLSSTHGRINLDIGSFAFDQMLMLEAAGRQYRFHLVRQKDLDR